MGCACSKDLHDLPSYVREWDGDDVDEDEEWTEDRGIVRIPSTIEEEHSSMLSAYESLMTSRPGSVSHLLRDRSSGMLTKSASMNIQGKEVMTAVSLLRSIPYFSSLSQHELLRLRLYFETQTLKAYCPVLSDDSTACSFMVILSGTVDVLFVDHKAQSEFRVTSLGRGSWLNEHVLAAAIQAVHSAGTPGSSGTLPPLTRPASSTRSRFTAPTCIKLVAASAVRVLSISGRRYTSFCTSTAQPHGTIQPPLHQLLGDFQLFKAVQRDRLPLLAYLFQVKHYSRKDFVVRQGDAGDGLYLILSGRCIVSVAQAPSGLGAVQFKSSSAFITGKRASAPPKLSGSTGLPHSSSADRMSHLQALEVISAHPPRGSAVSAPAALVPGAVNKAGGSTPSLSAISSESASSASEVVAGVTAPAPPAATPSSSLTSGGRRGMRLRLRSPAGPSAVLGSPITPSTASRSPTPSGTPASAAAKAVASVRDALAAREQAFLETLHPGDYFGETALVSNVKRTCSVQCATDLSVLFLPATNFKFLLSLVPELDSASFRRTMQQRTANMMKTIPLFDMLMRKQVGPYKKFDQRLNLLASLFHFVEATGNVAVFERGDKPDGLYIITAGTVKVTCPKNGKEEEIGRLGPGKFFGEVALLEPTCRTATVTTLSDCVFLHLSRENFRTFLEIAPELEDSVRAALGQHALNVLHRLPFLQNELKEDTAWEKLSFLGTLFSLEAQDLGQVVFEAGNPGLKFYICIRGAIHIFQPQTEDKPPTLRVPHPPETPNRGVSSPRKRPDVVHSSTISSNIDSSRHSVSAKSTNSSPNSPLASHSTLNGGCQTSHPNEHRDDSEAVHAVKRAQPAAHGVASSDSSDDDTEDAEDEVHMGGPCVVLGVDSKDRPTLAGHSFVKTLLPGAYFGEVAVMTEQPHSYTAVCGERSVFLTLPANEFAKFAELAPEIKLVLRERVARGSQLIPVDAEALAKLRTDHRHASGSVASSNESTHSAAMPQP